MGQAEQNPYQFLGVFGDCKFFVYIIIIINKIKVIFFLLFTSPMLLCA